MNVTRNKENTAGLGRTVALATAMSLLAGYALGQGEALKLELQRSDDLKNWERVPIEVAMVGEGGGKIRLPVERNADFFRLQKNAPQHLLTVTPHPQEVLSSNDTTLFRIDSTTSIRVRHDEDLPGAELLAQDVKRRAGLQVEPLKDSGDPGSARNVIYISRVEDDVALGFSESFLESIEVTRGEGYSLVISNGRVLIRAVDARGAVYGVQTLRQLLQHDMTLPNKVIRDWPEMPERMIYGNFNGFFESKEAIDGYVDRALMLKYNALVFESIWNAGRNWWFNHAGQYRELAQYFQAQCQKYHIEFIPLVQGPGWGYGITDQNPMLSTGVWIQDERQRLRHATPTALEKRNVVTNVSAPIVVKNLAGDIEYQKDVDFTVLPGTTVRPYAPANAPWRLQAIASGGIADGQVVAVSYNAVTVSTSHQAWNLSDPEAFRILDRTLNTVHQSMNPPRIHIGHDEIWQLGTDSRDLESGFTVEELVQRELMHWYNRIKANNPQANILLWDDLLRPARSGASYGILTAAIGEIPKDLVVVPWYYYASATSAATIRGRIQHLTSSGFSVIGAPSGYFRENSYLWYQELQPYIEDGRARGMMFTVWDFLHRGDMVTAGELMWSGQKLDRELFLTMDSITERMKARGIVLTLSPKVQMTAFANIVANGLKANITPDQISADFTAAVGDTSAHRQAIGEEAWNSLAKNASSPEQEIANLRKVPLFLQTMTDYVKADTAQDKVLLESVIRALHELNHISFAEHAELFNRSQTEWINFRDLYGIDLPNG